MLVPRPALAISVSALLCGCAADVESPEGHGGAPPIGEAQSAIENGQEIPADGPDNPGVVKLENGSGTLLSNQWVLTAAHCGHQPGSLVTFGAQAGTVARVVTHPSFGVNASSSVAFSADVALVRLTNPLSVNGLYGRYRRRLVSESERYWRYVKVGCYGYGANAVDANGVWQGVGPLRAGWLLAHGYGGLEGEPGIPLDTIFLLPQPDLSQVFFPGDSGGPCLTLNASGQVDASSRIASVHSWITSGLLAIPQPNGADYPPGYWGFGMRGDTFNAWVESVIAPQLSGRGIARPDGALEGWVLDEKDPNDTVLVYYSTDVDLPPASSSPLYLDARRLGDPQKWSTIGISVPEIARFHWFRFPYFRADGKKHKVWFYAHDKVNETMTKMPGAPVEVCTQLGNVVNRVRQPVPCNDTLIHDPTTGRVYTVIAGTAFYIPDPPELESMYGAAGWSRIVEALPEEVARWQAPPIEGSLLYELPEAMVYRITGGFRQPAPTIPLSSARRVPRGSMSGLTVVPCAPLSQAEACAGKNCGTASDGCYSVYGCGTCSAPQTCGGGGTPGVCACAPESEAQICARLGKNCGLMTATDNCGTTRGVICGTCSYPQSCGGGGSSNVCGCTPLPQSQVCAGKNCGLESDGCTGTYSCGQCPAGQACGGGGQNGVCGCLSWDDVCGGRECGTVSNGCTMVSCGNCQSGKCMGQTGRCMGGTPP